MSNDPEYDEAIREARKRYGPDAIFVVEDLAPIAPGMPGRRWVHLGVRGLESRWRDADGQLRRDSLLREKYMTTYGCGRSYKEALLDATLRERQMKRPRPKGPHGSFGSKDPRPLKMFGFFNAPPMPTCGTQRTLEKFYDGAIAAPLKPELQDLDFS